MRERVYLSRRVSFSMGHRLHNAAFTAEANHQLYGRCNNPNGHGHAYSLEATFAGPVDPQTGFCVDLDLVDEVLRREIVERFDHLDFNRDFPLYQAVISSGENLVRLFWDLVDPHLNGALVRMRLEETEKNAFEYAGRRGGQGRRCGPVRRAGVGSSFGAAGRVMKIEIRAARLADVPAVRSLAVDSVVHGIPHTRDVDRDWVRTRTLERLEELERVLQVQKHFRILVAEDVDLGQVVGYIMLDLTDEESSTGERQCMIHDLAVRRDYWGRYVVNHLIEAASEVTAAYGLEYLVGEVSASNRRTIGTATKALKFEIERHQIVRKVVPSAEPSEEARRLMGAG